MKFRGISVALALAAVGISLGAALFYPAKDPEKTGNDLRWIATDEIRVAGREDLPPPIENEGEGYRVWAIRRQAGDFELNETWIAAIQFMRDTPNIVRQILAGASTPQGVLLAELGIKARESSRVMPVIGGSLNDNWNDSRLFAANAYAGSDFFQPLRPVEPKNLLAAYTPWKPLKISKPVMAAKEERARPKIVNYPRGANHYREMVENFSRRYNLSTELVMAIIHSESNFSPGLVSPKSAMGLMQLLPSTASGEVHRFLYGRRGQVSFEQLSNPEINIRYGTAYLHILLNRYFQDVKDERVKEYCAIASYNLGPNRFLKLYGPTNALAVERINSMSPEEFYNDLSRRLPTRETRFYVEKVKRMKAHYAPQ